jgi:two-component system, LytTR family, sensor kinase
MLRNYSAGNFLLYWALVIVYYTIHYYQEARQQELQAVQLQADLTKAQLQSLRSQLNPHFLFNTINSISVLASKGEQRAVVETLSRLSDLLRASLDEKRPQEIPLSDELAFITGYLGIQQTRFSDRLTVQQEIQPDAMERLFPS